MAQKRSGLSDLGSSTTKTWFSF